jgi:hypothetical protein
VGAVGKGYEHFCSVAVLLLVAEGRGFISSTQLYSSDQFLFVTIAAIGIAAIVT